MEIDNTLEHLATIDSRFGEDTVKLAVKEIMDVHDDPEAYQDRLVGWVNVMKMGKYKVKDYVKAVHYCTLRSMELSMLNAYKQTFPDRCYKIVDGKEVKKPDGTLRALCSIYDKTDMVQKILAQMQIPLHIMMMSEQVKMARKLAELAMTADSERVQMEAADRLLTHIKSPEVAKVELDVSFKGDEVIQNISNALDTFAQIAHDRMKQGTITATQVIEHKSNE